MLMSPPPWTPRSGRADRRLLKDLAGIIELQRVDVAKQGREFHLDSPLFGSHHVLDGETTHLGGQLFLGPTRFHSQLPNSKSYALLGRLRGLFHDSRVRISPRRPRQPAPRWAMFRATTFRCVRRWRR